MYLIIGYMRNIDWRKVEHKPYLIHYLVVIIDNPKTILVRLVPVLAWLEQSSLALGLFVNTQIFRFVFRVSRLVFTICRIPFFFSIYPFDAKTSAHTESFMVFFYHFRDQPEAANFQVCLKTHVKHKE